jgi:hypothetical protein
MKSTIYTASALLLLAAPATGGTLHDPREVHLADVRQLTFGGENAEAYWSFDGRSFTFQSTRPPFACDQIFTLDPFAGGEPRLVSSGRGRTTCAHYLLGDERILWAATDAYAEACPPPPDRSQGYVWPIDPDYELFVADAGRRRPRAADREPPPTTPRRRSARWTARSSSPRRATATSSSTGWTPTAATSAG